MGTSALCFRLGCCRLFSPSHRCLRLGISNAGMRISGPALSRRPSKWARSTSATPRQGLVAWIVWVFAALCPRYPVVCNATPLCVSSSTHKKSRLFHFMTSTHTHSPFLPLFSAEVGNVAPRQPDPPRLCGQAAEAARFGRCVRFRGWRRRRGRGGLDPPAIAPFVVIVLVAVQVALLWWCRSQRVIKFQTKT